MKRKEVKLKPCPFCGSSEIEKKLWWVRCRGCGAMGPTMKAVVDLDNGTLKYVGIVLDNVMVRDVESAWNSRAGRGKK